MLLLPHYAYTYHTITLESSVIDIMDRLNESFNLRKACEALWAAAPVHHLSGAYGSPLGG